MEILENTRDFTVCIKPVGLDSEQDMPRALSEQLGGTFYPAHRLDKNVGGLMLYAKSGKSAGKITDFQKQYAALVHGNPGQQGDWTDFLYKDSRKNKVFIVKKQRPGVREARLTFTRAAAGEQSLVLVTPITGRTHQIRVQFAGRGFPLVGDHKYGSRAPEQAPMLFCCRMTFACEGKTYSYEKLPDWAGGVHV